MSLIALAQHVRGPRILTRTLLLLVLLTGGLILGLLAMHALNAHTAASAHPVSVVPRQVVGRIWVDGKLGTVGSARPR
jgi:hypothetical protein